MLKQGIVWFIRCLCSLCFCISIAYTDDSAQQSKTPKQTTANANGTATEALQRIPSDKKPFAGGYLQNNDVYAGFWPSWFQASITYRGRVEIPSGIGYAKNAKDAYYLSRVRIEAKLRVNRYISLFGMTQDARVYGYDNVIPRPASMVDAFDLRQAYIDIHTNSEKRNVSLRLGPQYLELGSKRLVGVSGWGNSGPVFDAARLSYSAPGITALVFAATRVTTIRAYSFNEPKKGENLYGAYLSFDRLIPNAKLEPYLFWRTQPQVTDEKKLKGDSDLATIGFRYFGKLSHGIDYSAEAAFQKGTYAHDSVSAWAGSWGLGYTLSDSKLRPKFIFEYNHATGDRAKGDGTRGTFDQLYPVNHSNYGIADQVGWKNTNNYKLGFEFQPRKNIRIQIDIGDYYLATLQDSLYTDGGGAILTNTKASSKHVGWEPDLQITYTPNRHLTLLAGYGRFNCGAFLHQSTQGQSFNYPYLSWEYRF